MNSDPKHMQPESGAPTDGSAAERLEIMGRTEGPMLKDGQTAPALNAGTILQEAEALGWSKNDIIAHMGCKSDSTASEIFAGKYKGNSARYLSVLKAAVDEEVKRSGREGFEKFARIRMTAQIEGGLNLAIRMNTHPVFLFPPGAGKTQHALALVKTNPPAVYVRLEDEPVSRNQFSDLLCATLTNHAGNKPLACLRDKPHPRRMRGIKEFLSRHPTMKIFIDECQKGSRGMLESARDISESVDPSGHRKIVIAFFGDERFMDIINAAKSPNGSSRMTSQLASRMFPVLTFEEMLAELGGTPYSVEDIVAITRNFRLKLLTDSATRWLTMLANVGGEEGLMRRAITVLKAATFLYKSVLESGRPLEISHLQEAMKLTCGTKGSKLLDAAAGGELLRATA